MTRIIPREQIKHLEWNKNNPLPTTTSSQSSPITSQNSNSFNPEVSIERIIAGTPFYNGKISIALRQALEYATTEGYVATMPELIAAKIKAEKTHDFWQKGYDVHTEENIGVDKKGRFYTQNDPVLVLVNGGGILTPDRIDKAYIDGLVNGSAKYEDSEFDNLLDGKLPDNTQIQLYKFEDIQKGVSNLPHRFGVVLPYSMAQGTSSGYHTKDAFITNPLVIARAGGIENLGKYFDLAKHSDETLGNHHPFAGRDASVPQGRLLYLYDLCGGLYGGSDLSYSGRFVGVAPEAHSAKK